MKRTFSVGGTHPPCHKWANDCAIETLPLPKMAYIPMNQHIGAPATVLVAKGDTVKTGQLIGKAGGFVSANIHSSVTGTVVDVAPYPDFTGKKVLTVVIKVEADVWEDGIDTSSTLLREIQTPTEEIIPLIAAAGIVGLGGAAFPTHVKLSPPKPHKATALILNGTECEPYLTSDYRLFMEHGDELLIGGEIMRRALGLPAGYIGIEDNKPKALALMEQLASKFLNWKVVPLRTKYPQGGEKQLIDAVLGKRVPSMALPIATGAIVQNVGTAFAVYEAVQKRIPLIWNIVTVTGNDPGVQHNYKCRMGTPLIDVLEAAGVVENGALKDAYAKVILGGPMMGKAAANLQAPLQKSTSALLLQTREEGLRQEAGTCLRCGKCIDACPMNLEPYLLYKLQLRDRTEDLDRHRVYDCIECGCCMYSCPAHLPLLDQIRLARAVALKNKRK